MLKCMVNLRGFPIKVHEVWVGNIMAPAKIPETFRFRNYTNLPRVLGGSPHLGSGFLKGFQAIYNYCRLTNPT